MNDLIRKRSATERLIIAKTLLESILQDMPTAEPRKGKWIVHDWTGLIVCDQCGFDAPMSTITGQQYGSEYCQTCGARMEESEC